MISKVVRALVNAGATPEMIAAAVDAYNQHTAECYEIEAKRVEEQKEARRATNRERMRLVRTRAAHNDAQTRTDAHNCAQDARPLKEIPPGPPKEIHPLSVVSAKASTTGAEAAPPDPEKELFGRGKAVLGKTAGGLIAELLRAKGGSIPLARAAIEQASTKQNPAEYIGAIVSGRIGKAPPKLPDGAIVNADGTWSRYAL